MSALIVLEGLDAVGKNTQSKLLAKKLDSVGRSSVVMSFPRYETTAGKAIRRHLMDKVAVRYEDVRDSSDHTIDGSPVFRRAPEDPLFLQALFLADKADAAVDIEDHLNNERIVICDRWTPSAICFGEADGLDATWLLRINEVLPLSDLNILIDVPEEEALRRRPQLRDRYEKDRAKQAVVRANYDTLWKAGEAEDDPDAWVRVDGVGTEEEVAERIWKPVAALLGVE